MSEYRGTKNWVCPLCKQSRKANGNDPCIPDLPGVKYACCGHGGHGAHLAYLYFDNGVRIGMIMTSVSYDDARPSIQVHGDDIRRQAGIYGEPVLATDSERRL
jgi:hypothetical protein